MNLPDCDSPKPPPLLPDLVVIAIMVASFYCGWWLGNHPLWL